MLILDIPKTNINVQLIVEFTKFNFDYFL